MQICRINIVDNIAKKHTFAFLACAHNGLGTVHVDQRAWRLLKSPLAECLIQEASSALQKNRQMILQISFGCE
jgi:hypothetical protein